MVPAAISKPELFHRLAAGHAAGIAVVTPNRRLARVLKAEFDSFQAGGKLAVWEDADILPFDAFAARCYEEALYAVDAGGGLPLLLSEAQSRALWEDAIRGSRWHDALLDLPRTAAQAQDAWRLAHAWRIAGALEKFALTEDTRAFADWSKAYARRLKEGGFIDTPLLFDVPLKSSTKFLVAYAFDVLPPQTREFLARFDCVSCGPAGREPAPRKISCASPREELESAARWARGRLEEGMRRIGVVVPHLELRRREAERVFRRIVGSPQQGSPQPFEISIGEPLSGHAIVDCALSLLQFSIGDIEFEQASRLLRSPFLGGAESEMASRARLDARLRRGAGAEISLPKLIGMVEGNPSLRTFLEAFFRQAKENEGKSRSPQDFARHYTALLDAAGFPGERAIDSAEFQARARFNEILGEFSRLGLVAAGFSSREALRQLRRLCAETLFQPEGAGGGGAPVQVLGLLEAAGIEFDALWVSSLTGDLWPQRLRPNPFLPLSLQRKAGIPAASAEASLALDRQRTAGWLRAADEVVVSWARREEDRALSPSPLIAQVPEGAVDLPSFDSWRESIFRSGKTVTYADETAPPLVNMKVRGGTRVLADQAACPFRAFARHRLGAEALDAPEPGLDAMARGSLLHSLMAGIWLDLKSSSALAGDLEASIEKAAERAVREQAIEGPFAELEKRRLVRLAREWLDIERDRPPFEVVQVEQKKSLQIGGLSFDGRIDRMDRFLEGEMRGSHAIIDYKTGRATRSSWLGERPDEPQLPLYAVSAEEGVSVVAFAMLRPGEMKFSGYGLKDGEIAGVQAAKSWPGLMQYWKTELENLASGFARGEAKVDPKKGFATCRNCGLQPLCRVHERLGALGAEEEGGE